MADESLNSCGLHVEDAGGDEHREAAGRIGAHDGDNVADGGANHDAGVGDRGRTPDRVGTSRRGRSGWERLGP